MIGFESEKKEYFKEDKYKNCLLKKLTEFKQAFESSALSGKVDEMMAELKKIRPEQVMNESHFGHILGQLNVEAAYVVRLKKLREKAAFTGSEEDCRKVRGCEQTVDEVEKAISGYIDLCLSNKDYFYAELSSKDGYFAEKELNPGSNIRIEGLNAKEFVMVSKDILEEK